MDSIKKTHPRWGIIGVSRYTTAGEYLFGSSIKNHSGVTITISHAEKFETDGHESLLPEKTIAEVHLTEYQWGQLVSTLNCGFGVPCTLRVDENGLINGSPIDPEVKFYEEEQLSDASRRAQHRMDGVISQLQEKLDSGKPVGKKELAEILRQLQISRDNFASDANYATTKVKESCEKIVASAKAEIEAYVLNRQIAMSTHNQIGESRSKLIE